VSGAVNHGFLYTGGTYITLDDPLASSGTVFSNANGTTALDINAKGQVVGYYYYSNSTVHGFLYDNGTYTTLDDPSASPGPGSGTFANGINDKGEIVGYFINNGSTYNFLYSHGTYTTLDIFRIPEGITNSGQIITDGGYSPGGYIFTPTGPVQHTPKAGLDNGVAVNDVLTAGRGEPSVTLDGWGMGNGAIHDHLVTADSSAPPVQDTPKADVALLRNYMASAFVAGSDGHGGTPIAAATSSDQPTIAPPPAH
jgi:probable HAF family extracellular repeat protein